MAAGIALVILTAITCFKDWRYHMTQLPVEVLPASEALRRVAPPGSKVMARKPQIAYYADMGFVPLPNVGTLQDMATQCQAQGADYVYFSWPEADLRPQFAYLLDTSAQVPGLQVITKIEHNPAVVYQVTDGFGVEPDWLADDATRKVHDARAEVMMHEEEAWQAHLTLAVDAGVNGRYEEARDHLEVVIRQRPGHVRAWILLGEARLRLKQSELAREAFETALKRDPRSVDAQLGLGWVEYHAGRLDRAAEIWRPVVEETVHIPTLETMVQVYSKIGDRVSADVAQSRLIAQSAGTKP
jgi:tetratricopeptide (TPR) repeat protein